MLRIVNTLLLFVVSTMTLDAKEIQSFVNGQDIVATIPTKANESGPRWEVGAGNPPVSARQALELAHKELKRFNQTLEFTDDGHHWEFRSLSLVAPQRHGYWYWVARFYLISPSREVRSSTMPEHLDIPVLMSGQAATLRFRVPTADPEMQNADDLEESGSRSGSNRTSRPTQNGQ